MRFRHLDYTADADVGSLGAAALEDILDRGDLDAWKPLARLIARDPWGAVADAVLRLCEERPMYGTSVLWRDWILQKRAGDDTQAGVSLAAARAHAGMTQSQVAHRMGISQTDVSKLERRRDARLSTLDAYARALGATLQLTFEWRAGHTPLQLSIVHGSAARRRRNRNTSSE
jgi:DNA-binding XRE family transcriptional regulator